MQIFMQRLLVVGAATVLGVVACGSDDVGSGPGGPSSGGSSASGGSSGNAGAGGSVSAPEPGTCYALCCVAEDCETGQACNAFDAASGTLGACSGATSPDGGAPVSGDPLPAACWTQNTPSCNPFTNSNCSAGEACDYGGAGDPTVPPEVTCYDADNTQGPGEDCDAANGPWCIPGFHCVPN